MTLMHLEKHDNYSYNEYIFYAEWNTSNLLSGTEENGKKYSLDLQPTPRPALVMAEKQKNEEQEKEDGIPDEHKR